MKLEGKRVLTVEDEPIIAFALEDLLTDAGAQPFTAASLEKADAFLAEQTIDLAILDVNLHGESSYPLARRLQKQGVPFIFATGYGESMHPAEFLRTPTTAKPYRIEDIIRALDALDALG